MTSMFKNMFHTFSGHTKGLAASGEGATQNDNNNNKGSRRAINKQLASELHEPSANILELPNAKDLDSLSQRSGRSQGSRTPDELSEPSNNNCKKGGKQKLGRKGRKKLSAMMGKIQSIGNSKTQRNNAKELISDQNNNNTISANGNQSSDEEHFFDLELDDGGAAADHVVGSGGLIKGGKGIIGSGGSRDSPNSKKSDHLLPEEQCEVPTFLHTKNCDRHLIDETRRLLKERYAKNPDAFYDNDYKRMLADDWTVSRFLLRRRLDPRRTAKLMEECGRFRKQYKMSEVKLWEFPIEFHKAGGLFMYAPDRVGNITVYMRVKMYRRVPEISDVFKAFILCVLEESDMANDGRGTAVIFDLSSCGLQNVDLSFLSWLLSSFRNYCPKGVSYILVYNLPWILNATCKLAMTWMSASNRRTLRFVYGDEIENFIARENLPDYLGGTCSINYRHIPEGSKPAIEVCDRLDMTREQALKIRELFQEYLNEDDLAPTGKDGQVQHQQRHLTNETTGGSEAAQLLQASKFVA